jgi:iron complex outermembrane receptor protein
MLKCFFNKNLIFVSGIVFISQVFSNENYGNIDQQFYEEMVVIASGYLQNANTSPSTVSVITSKDIEKIGAITLSEVLETIPGIHVSDANGYLPTYVIRGIGSALNTPVLIYLDGISINNAVTSTSYFSLSQLVRNIERIEIIKGPGSALYGADAFSGVINIITKQETKTDAGAFAGSFDTFGGWVNTGYELNDFKLNFSAQGRHTGGSSRIIAKDRQTEIDKLVGAHASLAPGPINRGREEVDLKLSAQYKDHAKIYLRYIRNDTQMGAGLTNALDNSGVTKTDIWVSGLEFKFGSNDWQTKLNLNYTGFALDVHTNIFPKGASGGLFLDPVTTNFGYTTHDLTTELSTVFSRIKNHKLHVGVGFEYDTTDGLFDERNFLQGPLNILVPVGSLKNTQELGVQPFGVPQSRYNVHGFIQDEWRFLNDFSLTTGVRLDYFSDFGLTVNPRASLIWNHSSSLTTKLMYGRAFRAPSFFELYANPGVAITGNRDLNPETIQTVEWSIIKSWSYDLSTQLNLFWYETEDLITETKTIDRLTQSETRQFANSRGVNTYGLELDFNYQLLDSLSLDINYTYLKMNPKSPLNDQFIITAPQHQIYAAINWDFAPNWSANIRSNSVLGRKRSAVDARQPIKDYTQLDFTLQGKQILGYLDVTFKINNFLDANVREPSVDQNAIPGDYPLDGRSFTGIVSMRF